MNKININLIKKLREITGFSIMKCKESLVNSDWNIELATQKLKETGKNEFLKRKGRIAPEGAIFINVKKNKKHGAILEINCESDFVSKCDSFKRFGNEIVNFILHNKITNVNFLKNKVEKNLISLINNVGENVEIRRLDFLKNKNINYYLHHNMKIGVLISTIGGSKNLIRKIAMHIASNNSFFFNKKYSSYKNENYNEKINNNIPHLENSNKENKKSEINNLTETTKDIPLEEEYFIFNTKKTVGQILIDNNIKINKFIRFEVGKSFN